MNRIKINAKGEIISYLSPKMILSSLINEIKTTYPELKNEKILIMHSAKYLLDEQKNLYELGVEVNIDTLRVLPNKLWKYFS
jgi:hypothetical protein